LVSSLLMYLFTPLPILGRLWRFGRLEAFRWLDPRTLTVLICVAFLTTAQTVFWIVEPGSQFESPALIAFFASLAGAVGGIQALTNKHLQLMGEEIPLGQWGLAASAANSGMVFNPTPAFQPAARTGNASEELTTIWKADGGQLGDQPTSELVRHERW
jgi:hypothetical protein